MSTLSALAELAWSRPSVIAPASIVAAWYERKATVLHRIAMESTGAEHDRYEVYAQQAHIHAQHLLVGEVQ